MKRKILIFSVIGLALVLVLPVLAAKDYGLNIAAGKAQYSVGGENNVYSIIETTINVFLALIGFVFFGLITMAGLRWMTARGNEEFVAKAKDSISAAIWGLIITVGAYAITTFVFNALNK